MKASELYEWLGENTSPDQEVIIEVGGDGALHQGTPVDLYSDLDANVVTISTED